MSVEGYEIHMGQDRKKSMVQVFNLSRSGSLTVADGALNTQGSIFGTYIHGLFDNAAFTGRLINNICRIRGRPNVRHQPIDREQSYNELADIVRNSIDMNLIYTIIAGGENDR